MRKICVVLTARPSYAKLKTVIEAMVDRGLVATVVACASALLERYGRVVDVVRSDFPQLPIIECWSTFEGENLITGAKETGALLMELAGVFSRERPDGVLVMADRHEVLAAAQAARYLHLPLIHCQGGERSGSVDDRVRDAITALADYHMVATELAGFRVYGLTGAAGRIFHTGCPSIDLARRAQSDPPVMASEVGGAGCALEMAGDLPLVLWMQHPVTSEIADAGDQMAATTTALHMGCYEVLAWWPGQDGGSGPMSKVLRRNQKYFHTVRNLPPVRFLRLLSQCAVLVGNSSAGIREAAYLGAPVVNVGTRQFGRQRGPNVIDVGHNSEAIHDAIMRQINHGRYRSDDTYGRGDAGQRIAELCSQINVEERPGVSAIC